MNSKYHAIQFVVNHACVDHAALPPEKQDWHAWSKSVARMFRGSVVPLALVQGLRRKDVPGLRDARVLDVWEKAIDDTQRRNEHMDERKKERRMAWEEKVRLDASTVKHHPPRQKHDGRTAERDVEALIRMEEMDKRLQCRVLERS